MYKVNRIETIDHGHKKLAHMLDTNIGKEFIITFGGDVSDARIRFIAPMLAKKEMKPKRRGTE
ncbi:hypothetical protein [Paenibacillus ehimensis]|uniref:Uncharacterized protein n=1 Tax=Paenibacillus ehimensis TaxID=79264 RepID=A0ABT8VMF8_9BACL|nr:hypothetical protein [Paenibacillus ehimensis]MDO3682164.1 hypothetical protein [Paenibacillus ehimensis]